LARGLFLAGDLSVPVALYRGGRGRAPCSACSSGMGWCRAHAVRASMRGPLRTDLRRSGCPVALVPTSSTPL